MSDHVGPLFRNAPPPCLHSTQNKSQNSHCDFKGLSCSHLRLSDLNPSELPPSSLCSQVDSHTPTHTPASGHLYLFLLLEMLILLFLYFLQGFVQISCLFLTTYTKHSVFPLPNSHLPPKILLTSDTAYLFVFRHLSN
jgi:hypothetical protein